MKNNFYNKNKKKEFVKNSIVSGVSAASPFFRLILPDDLNQILPEDLNQTNETFGNRDYNRNYNEIQSENNNENNNENNIENNNEWRFNYKYENNNIQLPTRRPTPKEDPNSISVMLMKLFNLVIGLYAIYLAFSCNAKYGFPLGAFLVACCCPWLYIFYAFVALKCYK